MAFRFTLKIERCYSVQDLRDLLPEFQRNLAKARGEPHALAVVERMHILVG